MSLMIYMTYAFFSNNNLIITLQFFIFNNNVRVRKINLKKITCYYYSLFFKSDFSWHKGELNFDFWAYIHFVVFNIKVCINNIIKLEIRPFIQIHSLNTRWKDFRATKSSIIQ